MPAARRASLGRVIARLDEVTERASAGLVARAHCAPAEVRAAVSPYRVCPVGAHSDHQHGPVLGTGVDVGSALAYVPSSAPMLELSSADFPGLVRVRLGGGGAHATGTWGAYVASAAAALAPRLPPRPVGLRGHVVGALAGGGLSSSASVLVAYLLALADVNEVHLDPTELVELARRAENEGVGVASGALDPACVVGSRRGHLLAIGTRAATWTPLALPVSVAAPRFLVVFTGASRNLANTDFNRRVSECRAAARQLGELAGRSSITRLGELEHAVFEAHASALPIAQRRRAEHFFSERARVLEGRTLWERGDLAGLGKLMNASCESSIRHYETGSPELVGLQEILLTAPGVLGARFSGAGFGGCSVALLEQTATSDVTESILRAFTARFPALKPHARAFPVEGADGAHIRKS